MTDSIKRWYNTDIHFDLNTQGSSDPVVTIEISAPGGVLALMGEPVEQGRSLIVRQAHVQSWGFGPNTVGIRNLRVVAKALMEMMSYDDISIEGEIRTTGAGQGRRP